VLRTGPLLVEFESGQVRPIALSPDGTRLFAVNTPNGALEIFTITPAGLSLQGRVPVGMEPVAVAARDNNEVWVVNHLSDSVSVVSLIGTPHVTRTLLVGDEPATLSLPAPLLAPLSRLPIADSSGLIPRLRMFPEQAIHSLRLLGFLAPMSGYSIPPIREAHWAALHSKS